MSNTNDNDRQPISVQEEIIRTRHELVDLFLLRIDPNIHNPLEYKERERELIEEQFKVKMYYYDILAERQKLE